MSVDKRTVHTDALDTLGYVIGPNEKRDAIHLAVDPVVAATDLSPGQHVGFVEGGVGPCDNPVGIVDPFLPGDIEKGAMFWLVVYPRKITSLRHVWTHPAFDSTSMSDEEVREKDKAFAESWLRDFADRYDCPSYEHLLEAALEHPGRSYDDEYLHFNGMDAHGEIPTEFWDFIEIVTGKELPQANRAKWFSCSC